jgi:hypothetical protein
MCRRTGETSMRTFFVALAASTLFVQPAFAKDPAQGATTLPHSR